MARKASAATRRKQQLKAQRQEAQQFKKHVTQLIKEAKRERDNLLLRTIKRASKVGVYNPKELKLTSYRRKRATTILKEFGDTIDPTKFFFIEAPKKTRKAAIKRAESLQMRHSRTGIFIPKEGHTKANLKYDKKHDELYIERSGKTKRGPTKGKSYRTITPLASADELDKERNRLRNLARKLGTLQDNERLTFVIRENGLEGYAHNTYSNIELLLSDLDRYNKTLAARVNFFRHIEIVKTQSAQWFAEHPTTRAGNPGRKDRDALRSRIKKLGGGGKASNGNGQSKKNNIRFRF